MKIKWLIILTVLLFSACNPTILIKSKDLSYAKMIENLQGEKVSIELKNGKTVKGRIKNITIDTVYHNRGKISIKEIAKITHIKSTKDPLKGFLYCAIAGLAIEIIPGAISHVLIMGPIGLMSDITNRKENYIFTLANKTSTRVKFSSVVESDNRIIKILWKNKEIQLLRSEYNNILKTEKGKQLIVEPKEVYLEKFE